MDALLLYLCAGVGLTQQGDGGRGRRVLRTALRVVGLDAEEVLQPRRQARDGRGVGAAAVHVLQLDGTGRKCVQ